MVSDSEGLLIQGVGVTVHLSPGTRQCLACIVGKGLTNMHQNFPQSSYKSDLTVTKEQQILLSPWVRSHTSRDFKVKIVHPYFLFSVVSVIYTMSFFCCLCFMTRITHIAFFRVE
ncbi:hypothetical protein OTU49_004822 [Cherax quadricarinatus]|uniref:Uncharacterized protein n=1 Tax=Cherax quadricarinatus TaxID=27406 RepID=A0AAW0WYH5_CHEQU